MRFYCDYNQTPELRVLSSQERRDAVHSLAWKRFSMEHPNLGLRGLLMVFPGMVVACVIGHLLLDGLLPGRFGRLDWPIALIGGLGAGIGALIHFHCVATALRPYYRDIIRSGEIPDSVAPLDTPT